MIKGILSELRRVKKYDTNGVKVRLLYYLENNARRVWEEKNVDELSPYKVEKWLRSSSARFFDEIGGQLSWSIETVTSELQIHEKS